jgi:hypothetical protein
VNASNCRKYLTLLAERVGFVPVVPSPINGLGQIKSPQTAKSTQKLSIRYKTGTAQLPSFAAGQVQLVCVEEFHRVPDEYCRGVGRLRQQRLCVLPASADPAIAATSTRVSNASTLVGALSTVRRMRSSAASARLSASKYTRCKVASCRRVPWKTIRPVSPAVSGLGAVMVAPDSAIGYSYSRSRCELYAIKGLK